MVGDLSGKKRHQPLVCCWTSGGMSSGRGSVGEETASTIGMLFSNWNRLIDKPISQLNFPIIDSQSMNV